MAIEIHKLAVEDRDDLVNSVRKKEASVKHRHFAFCFRDEMSVKIYCAHNKALLEASPIVNNHIVIPRNDKKQ